MIKLIVKVAVWVAVLYVAQSILNGVLDMRLMDHFNECHAELGVANKIQSPPGAQRDKMFKQYEQCVKDKGTAVDNYLREDAIRQIIEVMKK